jgi:hypothetical protein
MTTRRTTSPLRSAINSAKSWSAWQHRIRPRLPPRRYLDLQAFPHRQPQRTMVRPTMAQRLFKAIFASHLGPGTHFLPELVGDGGPAWAMGQPRCLEESQKAMSQSAPVMTGRNTPLAARGLDDLAWVFDCSDVATLAARMLRQGTAACQFTPDC